MLELEFARQIRVGGSHQSVQWRSVTTYMLISRRVQLQRLAYAPFIANERRIAMLGARRRCKGLLNWNQRIIHPTLESTDWISRTGLSSENRAQYGLPLSRSRVTGFDRENPQILLFFFSLLPSKLSPVFVRSEDDILVWTRTCFSSPTLRAWIWRGKYGQERGPRTLKRSGSAPDQSW